MKILNFIRHPLFTGSALMVTGTMSVNVLNYLYHFILGKLLGPSGYGELVALISVVGLLGIVPTSLNLVVIKYISSTKDSNEVNNLIRWLRVKVFQSSLLIFALIILVSPYLSSFLHISNIIYLYLIAASFLFSILAVLNRAILQGMLMFKEMIFSIFGENLTKLLVSILFVYLGFYLFGAMLALVFSAAFGCYLSFIYLKVKTTEKTHYPASINKMILFAFPVILQSFSVTSLYTSDLILVKHFFSAHQAGIYASLSTLGKIIFFAASPITAVMFPLISHKSSRGEKYKEILNYSFIITLILSLIVLIGYWFFPNLAITTLYSKEYLEAAPMLFGFGAFITMLTLSVLLINYGLSIGRTKVVGFPLIGALTQILLIWLFHQSLMQVIFISTAVTALLLISLLIYSSYGKQLPSGNKIGFSDSSHL